MLILGLRIQRWSRFRGCMLYGCSSRIVLMWKNLNVLKEQHKKPFAELLGVCNHISILRQVLEASDKAPAACHGSTGCCTAQLFQVAQALSSCWWWQCCMQMWSFMSKPEILYFYDVRMLNQSKGDKLHCDLKYAPLLEFSAQDQVQPPTHGELFLGKEREHFWLNRLSKSAVAILEIC